MSPKRSAYALGLLAWAGVSSALAHDTWLLPATFVQGEPKSIALQMTSGMDFPRPETAVKPERLAMTGARFRGQTRPLEVGAAQASFLSLSWNADGSGVALLWAESKPRTLSLKREEVREYLEEVGAWDTVGKRWEARPSRSWRESYVKVAKTYVRRGAAEDASWKEPAGLDLEILPEADPTALRAGQEFPIRLLRKGQPVADLAIGAAGDAGKPLLVKTDATGRARLTLDRPGPWLIRATLIRESALKDVDWESVFTTLTIQVQPAR